MLFHIFFAGLRPAAAGGFRVGDGLGFRLDLVEAGLLLEFHDLVAEERGFLVVHRGGGGEHFVLEFLQHLRHVHVGAALADDVRRRFAGP